MNELDNQVILAANIFSNVLAVIVLISAWKGGDAARVLFFLIFGLACWINWQTALQAPEAYLAFGPLALFPWYEHFINGWFSEHTLLVVGFIATCQGLIALAMLLRGWVYKTGTAGGALFLLAVTPLGIGAAFPCTLVLAIAMILLWDRESRLLPGLSPMVQHG